MTSDQDEDSDGESSVSQWEVDEGLPQHQDQFIQKYLQGREALIEQEKSQRSDYSFRQSLTPLAIEACNIVSRIMEDERKKVWTDSLQDQPNVHPGMMFSLAKQTMKETKSWNIVKRMPKGALLHAHVDAMVDIDWLIDHALATEGMSMAATNHLSSGDSRTTAELIFRFKKSIEVPSVSIWSHDYTPSQFVSMREAASSFPSTGLAGFKAWLKGRCTIAPNESIRHHMGVNDIWRKFASCFGPLNALECYEPILRAAVHRILCDLIEDGVRWVDFRSMFCVEFFLEGQEEAVPDNEDFLRVWHEEVERFKKTEKGKDLWGCRFIWTSLRFWEKKRIVEHMKQCIEMKILFPELICGYDVVGQEDKGRPLADLTPELFWFKKRCFENGVDIPFFFHAGECLGDGNETDNNLFDAILLGTRRIGHGFSLYKHPLLIEMVKSKRILIESCPISNEVLRLTSSIKSHPLPALLARGVACSLSNDDPAIFDYGGSGVTHDFWQALQGWENLGLEGLAALAENSVRWAAFAPDQNSKEWIKDVKDGLYGEGVRASRMREWTAQWNKFCEWIVKEYAVQYGGDTEE